MTTTYTNCQISGEWLTCPADSAITLNGRDTTKILANLTCPLDTVEQSNFIKASQDGNCICDTALIGPGEVDPLDVNCGCFACPQGSRIGFAFACDRPIIGQCFNFSCDATCNGDLNFFDPKTFAPTASPTEAIDAAPVYGIGSSMSMVAIVTLMLFRIIR